MFDAAWSAVLGRDGEADKGDALKVAAEDRDFVPTKKTDDKLDAKPGLPQLPSTKDRAGSGGAGRSLLVAKSLENIYDVSPRPARRITTSISAPSNVANELIVRNATQPHSLACPARPVPGSCPPCPPRLCGRVVASEFAMQGRGRRR